MIKPKELQAKIDSIASQLKNARLGWIEIHKEFASGEIFKEPLKEEDPVLMVSTDIIIDLDKTIVKIRGFKLESSDD